MAVEQAGVEDIMAIGEDIRFDADNIADNSLYCEAAGINFRGDVFDNDARGRWFGMYRNRQEKPFRMRSWIDTRGKPPSFNSAI